MHNKLIEKLVSEHFNKRNTFNQEEFFFQDQLYNMVVSALNEGIYASLHIVTNFDECIDDIVDNWINARGRLTGILNTGWVYNIKTTECYKCDDSHILNNEEYQIFIEYIFNEHDVPAYSKIRGIDLSLNDNKIIIGYNNRMGGGIRYIKARLKHEFTHIRE